MSVTIKAAFQWNGDGDLLRAKNLETGADRYRQCGHFLLYAVLPVGNRHTGAKSVCGFSSGRRTGHICNAVCQIPVLRGGHGAEHPRVRGRYGNAYTVLFAARTGEAPDRQGADLPLAGAFWFERMKADHMQDILEEARNVANGK